MKLPDFFDQVPRLRVRDPLAELLGCAEGGVLEYTYADAVRLTGHSCPTVAGAYWITWLALAELFPSTLPQRGGLRVEFRQTDREGSTGVFASVVQMLTGAADERGFRGLAGRHSRVGLQRYVPDLPHFMRYTRLDNGAAVDASVDLSLMPPDPVLSGLLTRLERGQADPAALAQLAALWQRRVKSLLLDHADDRGIFAVRRVERRRLSRGPTPLVA